LRAHLTKVIHILSFGACVGLFFGEYCFGWCCYWCWWYCLCLWMVCSSWTVSSVYVLTWVEVAGFAVVLSVFFKVLGCRLNSCNCESKLLSLIFSLWYFWAHLRIMLNHLIPNHFIRNVFWIIICNQQLFKMDNFRFALQKRVYLMLCILSSQVPFEELYICTVHIFIRHMFYRYPWQDVAAALFLGVVSKTWISYEVAYGSVY